MKLLLISHEYPPIGGGGANACMNLAREYGRAGHKVNIVTAWYEGTDEYSLEDNVAIHRVKSRRSSVDYSSFWEMLDFIVKAKPIIAKLAKEEGFDICQVFFGIPSGPLGLYLKKRFKIPYVIRFGGGDIPGFQDRFAFIYKLIGPLIKYIWKNADALVANSYGLQKMALDFYEKKQICVIPNGANIDVSAPPSIEKKQTQAGGDDFLKIKLLFVSRLIERKGLQDILPQLKEVQERCLTQEIQIELDVVGDGPYLNKLKEIAAIEGIRGIVHFNGQKTKLELPAFYSEADIFIFPSRKEGMPNVVLEAMAYGLPIVMTPCEGSEELIHGNGFVCNTNEFKDRIIQLCQDTKLRHIMGEKSRELIMNCFSWTNTAKQYLKVFEEISYID